MKVALSEVRRINYIVTIDDVVGGRLSELRDKGVNYTLVCAKGTGRSVNAADFADREIEMPVVAISGGAYFIEISRYFNEIVEQILARNHLRLRGDQGISTVLWQTTQACKIRCC